jgi:LppM domain
VKRRLPDGRRVLSIVVLVFVMTGCMKLDMELKLSSDDTASGAMTFALDKQIVELTGGSFDALTDGQTPLPSGVDVSASDYEDDRFVGKTYTFEDVPIEQMNDSTDAESMQIRRDGDTYVVSGELDLTTDALEGGTGGQLGQAALQNAEVRIAITFPGAVQSATGQIDGNTVTWTPKIGERTELSAVGSAIGSDGASSILWIVLAVLAAVAIVVLVMLRSRRNRRPPETAFSGVPPPVPGGVPSPSAPEQPVMPSAAPDQPIDAPIPEQPVEPHRPVMPPPDTPDTPPSGG